MMRQEHPYSPTGAFFLDNPIRRWLQPPSEIINKLPINPNDVVMDFGSGPGFFTTELAKKAKTVIAVDLSSEMLSKAQKKAEKNKIKNIQFLQSNGKRLQLEPESVDLILLVTVYHEVNEHEAVLAEFSRVLKTKGKLAVVEVIHKGFFPSAPLQNPDVLQAEIESGNFILDKLIPYKNYGIFLFTKKSQRNSDPFTKQS
jgi:ubiquinone/menaquinone biosynthesis C-methylase UbiE